MVEQPKLVFPVPRQFNESGFEREFLRRFAMKRYAVRNSQVVFDLSRTRWIDLLQLVCLAIAAQDIRERTGTRVSFSFENEKSTTARMSVLDFCDAWRFIGFLTDLGIDLDVEQTNRIPSDQFLAITDLNNKKLGDLENEIIFPLSKGFPLLGKRQILSFVQAIVSEACENAQLHAFPEGKTRFRPCRVVAIRRLRRAKSEKGTSVAYWVSPSWLSNLYYKYPGSDMFEIVVADGGVGIFRSLCSAYKEFLQTRDGMEWMNKKKDSLKDEEVGCLLWAVSEHRSSVLQEKRSGYGLYRIIEHTVEGWGGAFLLRSGNTQLLRSEADSDTRALKTRFFFPGTQLRLVVPMVDRREAIADLLDKVDTRLGVDR